MRMVVALLLAGIVSPQPVAAEQRHGDQLRAYQAMRDGRILRLPEIEHRVLPTMPGWQYIGFDFDAASGVYTLKFLRDGRVVWVDVDGRSGQIIGRTGS